MAKPRKFPPGEYTAGRGTPARRHDAEPKDLSPGERARVARIRAQQTGGLDPRTDLDGSVAEAMDSEAAIRTNFYSESGELDEEV